MLKMLRTLIAGTTSTAVVASLVTAGALAGSVAGASPASATTPAPVANPVLEGCGIPVTLVLDASGSIEPSEQTQVKQAANAFLNGLDTTGSTGRILDFSTYARWISARENIQGAGLTALQNAVSNNYYNGGASGNLTNWESALWLAQGEPPPGHGLVVFVTDGDPNTIGLTDGNTQSTTEQNATDKAQVYSDQIKSAPGSNRMLAVGVGMSTDPNSAQAGRLEQISGPQFKTSLSATDSINDVDVLVTSSFDTLEAALKRVASSLCGGSVTVRKQTDAAQAGTYTPAGGWQFSVKVLNGTPGTDYAWIKPDPSNQTDTATGTTASTPGDPLTNGIVQFQYQPKNTTARDVRVSETLQAGYSPRSAPNAYTCTFKGISPPNDVSGALTKDGTKYYFDIQLKSDESASCNVYNTRDRASLKVKKIFDPKTSGFTGKFAIKVDCDNDAFDQTLNLAAGAEQTITGIPVGTKCTVTEPNLPTAPANWTFGTPTVNPSGEQVIGPKDATFIVNVTNTITRDSAKLTLEKMVSGGTATKDAWTLTATPNPAIPGQGAVSGSGDPSKAGGVNEVSVLTGTYDLSESSGPGTYSSDGTWTCTNATMVDKDTVTIAKGANVTCKITNTRNKGSLKITKIFDKPAGVTLPAGFKFKIDYVCQDGFTGTVSLDGSASGQSETVANVPTGACTFSEKALPDITDWTWDAVGYNPLAQKVVVTTGQTVEAKVTNAITRNTAHLTLQKTVEGKGAPNDWTLKAEGPTGAPSVTNLGGQPTRTQVWSGVEYTLSETGPDKYTAGTWKCESKDQEAALVVSGDKITLAKDEDVTCSIINTRNTAQLKLVKQVSGGTAKADDFLLSAKASAPDTDLNFSSKGGSGAFQEVFAQTQYTLSETGPGGYSPSSWTCVAEGSNTAVNTNDTITLKKGEKVTCTMGNTRDAGALKITKEFNALASGYTGTFDIAYACVDGTTPVKSGVAQLGDGQSATIDGLPTGTVCTVTEPALPAAPTGWAFNKPTFSPANGQATVATKGQTVDVRVVNSISAVSPERVKICPIDPTLKLPKATKVGNRVLIKKVKTNKACITLKPVVMCRPVASAADGQVAFCRKTVTRKGYVKVYTHGYAKVRVTVLVHAKPKPAYRDLWRGKTWRKSWLLR